MRKAPELQLALVAACVKVLGVPPPRGAEPVTRSGSGSQAGLADGILPVRLALARAHAGVC